MPDDHYLTILDIIEHLLTLDGYCPPPRLLHNALLVHALYLPTFHHPCLLSVSLTPNQADIAFGEIDLHIVHQHGSLIRASLLNHLSFNTTSWLKSYEIVSIPPDARHLFITDLYAAHPRTLPQLALEGGRDGMLARVILIDPHHTYRTDISTSADTSPRHLILFNAFLHLALTCFHSPTTTHLKHILSYFSTHRNKNRK